MKFKNHSLIWIAVLALIMGCNKSNSTGTDSKTVSQDFIVEAPAQSTPKKTEPPRLTPKHKFKSGIRKMEWLAVSDDGTMVAVGDHHFFSDSPQVEIWSVGAEPKKVRTIPGGILGFSTDGKLSTRRDKEGTGIEVVETTTGASVRVISIASPFEHVFEKFLGPEKLVVAGYDSTKPKDKQRMLSVGIFNARTGVRESGFEIPSSGYIEIRGPVNGRREIVVGWQETGRVEVWNLNTGKMERGINLSPDKKHNHWSYFEASPDGKYVSFHWDVANRFVGIYDLLTGTEVHSTGNYKHIVFVPGRNMFLEHALWSSFNGKFEQNLGWRAIDLTSKTIVADIITMGHTKNAMTPDGRVLVTFVDDDHGVSVWDLTQIP